jgi:hypothetical protein
MLISMASSAYTGTLPDIIKHFPGYSEAVYVAGLSLFVLGFVVVSLCSCGIAQLPTPASSGPLRMGTIE